MSTILKRDFPAVCKTTNSLLESLARVVIFAKGSRFHIISNKGQDDHSAWKEVPRYLAGRDNRGQS